jgi:azurin
VSWTGGAVADTTITIRSSGTNLEFLPSRISAKQGTRVTVRYVNEGTLPHNLVVVKNEDDIDTLGRAAFEAGDTDYVPLEHESLMIAHTALAAPGETVEVTFVVPPAGEYFFVCLYSGHYNMMVGTLRSLN